MTEPVRTERNGAVTTVILHRPHARNAVDGPTAAALVAAFEEFDADDSASVAVFWGDGGTFCAGADLKAFGTPQSNTLSATGPGPMGPSRMVLSKPVIAAISGYAVAGGLELALWCDMRVVEEDAVLGVFCRRWGVPLIDGGTVRLRWTSSSRAVPSTLPRPTRSGWPTGWFRKVTHARRQKSWQRNWRHCRSSACGPTGARRCTSGADQSRPQWNSSSRASSRSNTRPHTGPADSRRVRAATVPAQAEWLSLPAPSS